MHKINASEEKKLTLMLERQAGKINRTELPTLTTSLVKRIFSYNLYLA